MLGRSCLLAFGLLQGCAGAPPPPVEEPVSARLVTLSDAARADIRDAVSALTRRAQIVFGPGLQAGAMDFTVLPPRLTAVEGNSTALPERFDILIQDDVCIIQSAKTGARFPVPAVDCAAQR